MKKSKDKKIRNHWIFGTIKQLFGFAAIVLFIVVINTQIIQIAFVPTASMDPTISAGSFILGLRHPKSIERYDIVTFYSGDYILVKRVIGLPGETIEIQDGEVYADGKMLRDDFIKEPMAAEDGVWTVPEDSYFVMGDNRNHSSDSRYPSIGTVDKSSIIARIWKFNLKDK